MNENIQLWHCDGARSLRPLWAMEEMGIAYNLHVLPFPPRFLHKEFLEINPLGTVPYFVHAEQQMTESTGICHYLVTRFQKHEFAITENHPEYAAYLNWLYHSDATLTFPQTIYLRYSMLEVKERQQPQVAEDYKKWFLARLRLLDAHILGKQYLCDDRFTIADIAIGYALYLGKLQGLSADYTTQVSDYLENVIARPAFVRAISLTKDSKSIFTE